MPPTGSFAQGAIEYLLMLGAAILIVSVVIVSITAVSSAGKTAVQDNPVQSAYNDLNKLNGNSLPPDDLGHVVVTMQPAGSGVITSSDGNIDCGTQCSHDYSAPKSIILYADANAPFYAFAGWSGCDTNLGNTCTILASSSRTVAARFNLMQSTDFVPQNENALCIYNANSTLSQQICDYYLEKRHGVHELGLDIPESAFKNNPTQGGFESHDNGRHELMEINDFNAYVKVPLMAWVNSHPELKITHLAVAKDIPIKIGDCYDGYWFSGKSTMGFLELDPSLPWVDSGYGDAALCISQYMNPFLGVRTHFDPTDKSTPYYQKHDSNPVFARIRFVVSYLTGYTLDDIKEMIDKGSAPNPDFGNVQVVEDRLRTIPPAGVSYDTFVAYVPPQYDYDPFVSLPPAPPVLAFYSKGVHGGYNMDWMVNQVKFNSAPKAILSSFESFNARTFLGAPLNHRVDLGATQGLIADAFSSVAFGGTNYSGSVSGAVGNVNEPGSGSVNQFEDETVPDYVAGLTFAESATGGFYWSDWMGIAVGDPLMRINTTNEGKLAAGELCSNSGQCMAKSVCGPDKWGVNRCHATLGACVNAADGTESPSGGMYCADINNQRSCVNGNWQAPQACEDGYQCGLDGQCRKSAWIECSADSECDSNVCRNDLEGVKRCVPSSYYCISGVSHNLTSDGKYACVDASNKRQCLNSEWQPDPVSCANCANGFCEGDIYTPPATFFFPTKKNFPAVLTINPPSRKIVDLFPDPPDSSRVQFWDTNIQAFTGAQWHSVAHGTRPAGWAINNSDANSLEIPLASPFIFSSNQNYSVTFSGVPFTAPVSVHIKGYFTFIGFPFCAPSYTASKAIAEINALDSRCVAITEQDEGQGPVEWWSLDPAFTTAGIKKDFQIKNYEGYFVVCANATDMTWTPNC